MRGMKTMKIIYPSIIADNLIRLMKKCKTQQEIDMIWLNFKQNEKDKNIIEAVEEFIITYRNQYIIQTLDKDNSIHFIKEYLNKY